MQGEILVIEQNNQIGLGIKAQTSEPNNRPEPANAGLKIAL
jgi:hypothetical protein